MIIRLPLQTENKEPRETFKVNREYRTKTKITKRTVEVGQAFGLGIDEERTFTVFKDFVIEINPGQVVLITGDSGSGKSTLLQEICSQIANASEYSGFGKIVTNASIGVPADELIIHGVGKDTNEAISILSMAGLNEAFLMLRKFKELSDGQKYRYRVAKMINSEASTWTFDEFAALLDRVTAKVVSNTVQKTARKLGKTLIIATTHEDLLQDLKPDIWIQKKFGEAVSVTLFPKGSFEKDSTLLRQIKIQECGIKELEGLERFHYRGKVKAIVKRCFKAVLNDEIIAGIVYVCPHLALRGRNIAMPEYRGKSDVEMGRRVNRDILRISRVIVAPKFRSIGLGAEIVRHTMPLVNIKIVETLAVMAKYNPFFEHAGLTRVNVGEDEKHERDLSMMEGLGFRRELLPSRKYDESIISKIHSQDKLQMIKRFCLTYCAVNKRRAVSLIEPIKAGDKSAMVEALKLYSPRPVYLYWRNPSIAQAGSGDG